MIDATCFTDEFCVDPTCQFVVCLVFEALFSHCSLHCSLCKLSVFVGADDLVIVEYHLIFHVELLFVLPCGGVGSCDRSSLICNQ